jgi:hypothetical protein
MIGEFMAHDSKHRFGDLDHGPAAEPSFDPRRQEGRFRVEGRLILGLRLVGFDPNQTSISTRKRDTLRSRWVSNRTGESRNDGAKKRWSEKLF